jgi:hypothetical protein
MRHGVMLLLPAVLVLAPFPAVAQRDLTSFYSTARDRAAAPPDEASLTVVCDKELKGADVPEGYRGLHLSLLSAGSPRILLAAFSKKRLGEPKQAISLHVRYAPLPTALPSASGTLDWGYLYDRNGDGRVDYLVYLQNAHPVLPDPLPPDFPRVEAGAEGRIRVSAPLLHAMIDLGEMVFRHYADDNFDGRVDGAVLEEFDAERPMFVRDWLAYLASEPGGAVDRAWAFRRDLADTVRVLERDPGGYQVPAVSPGESAVPVAAVLDRASERLGVINAVLSQCKIGPEALDRGD